ncbi:sodium:calcium antiporter [Nocardioides furvisabuli]|nr:sodium:calcium antiporter [Nocardioides furvisabuli]
MSHRPTMNLLALAAGVVAAAAGGELFVRGAVGLAAWARVPAGIIGATVAAFATSSPELSVGVQSAMSGTPAIALGDALGSNVINIACVLGIVLVTGPLVVARRDLRRELGFAVAAPLLTLVTLVDGVLASVEAATLLGVFAGWLALVVNAARKARQSSVDELGTRTRWAALVSAVAGLALLVLAGRLIVVAAKGIGADLGLDPFIVGATFVALGTSTPELATVIISRRRGHVEVGVGTLLGSNVFNNLWIVGVAALIHPIRADVSEVLLAVVACLLALALVTPARTAPMGKVRGVLLLLVAAAYLLGTVLIGV